MAKPLLIGLDGLEDGQSFNQTKYRMKNIYCKILNSTLDVNLTKSRATNLLEVLNYGEKVLFGQIAVDYKKQFANDVKNGINESCRREWGRRKLTNEIETLSDNFAMQNRFSNLQLKAGNKFDSVFEFIGNLVGVKKYTRAELTKELLRKKQEKKYYKDTEYVEYTKKYKINYDFISSEDLINLEKNPAIAYEQIVKEKVWTPYDVQKLKDDGNTSGAAFYKVKLREYVQKRPANNKISRLLYVKGIEFLRNWLEDKKNLDDIVAYNTDYKRVPLFKKQLEELLENELTNEVVRIANISPNKTNINEEIPGSFRDYNTNAIFGKQFDYIINNADYGNEYVLRFYQNLRKADEKNLDWEENWDWADKYLDKTKKVTKKETTEDEGADKIEVSEKRLPLQHIVRKGGLKVTDDMITTEFIQKEFLYKNVIFGNYVNDRFSKQFVKYFIASMLDLGEILDLNINAINKAAGLSISFGSMGSGSGAVASYFPNHKTINLTKSKGDGSVAHEWAHYLDNILEDGDLITGTPKFATDTYKIKEVKNFLHDIYYTFTGKRDNFILLFFPGYKSNHYTEIGFSRQFFPDCKNLDEAIEKFKSYFRKYPGYGYFTIGDKKQPNYHKKNLDFYLAAGAYISKHFNNSKMVCIEADSVCSYMFRDAFYADLSKTKKYWTTPKEMFARAFECMVLQKLKKAGRENNYLIRVNKEGKDYSPDKDVFPWLVEKEDIEAIEPAFDELINMLREKFGSFQTSLTERENETTTLSDSFAMQNRNEFSMLYKYLDLEKKANGRFQNVFKFLRKITRIFTKEELDEEALKLKREKRKEWELRTGRDYIPTSKPNEFGINYDLFATDNLTEKADIKVNIEDLKNKVNKEIINECANTYKIYRTLKRNKEKSFFNDFEIKIRSIFDKYNLEVEDYYEDNVLNINSLLYDITKLVKGETYFGNIDKLKEDILYVLENYYNNLYRIKTSTLSDSFAMQNRFSDLQIKANGRYESVFDFIGNLVGVKKEVKVKDDEVIFTPVKDTDWQSKKNIKLFEKTFQRHNKIHTVVLFDDRLKYDIIGILNENLEAFGYSPDITLYRDETLYITNYYKVKNNNDVEKIKQKIQEHLLGYDGKISIDFIYSNAGEYLIKEVISIDNISQRVLNELIKVLSKGEYNSLQDYRNKKNEAEKQANKKLEENKQENIEYLKNKVNEEIFNGSIKAHEIYQKIKRKKQKVIELIDDFELKVRAIFDKYNLEVEDYYEDYVANIDTLIYDIAKKIKKDDNEPGIFEYVKNTIHYLLNNDYKKFYRIKSTTLSDSFAKNVSNRYYQLKNIAVTKFKNVLDFAGKLIGFSQNNILKGKDCKIITSSKKIGGYYAIYEIDFLIPSNDPFTFASNKNYPKECQTRSYSEDKSEQEKVALYSSEFLPGHLLNNSLDATTGPPIVLPEGVVLGGNGRSMVINRVAEQNKDAYSEYVNELKETAVIYGFNKKDIARFKKPVLVRVIEAPINECVTYSNILNSNTTQNYDEVREGIAVALQLEQKPHILNQLAQALEESEAESLSEMLDDKKIAAEIINILTREGILNNTNMSKLINLQANTFTQLGVVFVKVLLIGSILPDKKLIENAENYVNKIIKALPSVLRLRTLPAEWNLIPQIREVVKLETKRRARGIKSIQAYIMQDDAFESKPEPLTIELWRILNDVGINDFKNLLRFYVERAKEQGESSIFAEPSEPIVVLANWKDFNEKRKQKQTDERRLKQEWSEKHGN